MENLRDALGIEGMSTFDEAGQQIVPDRAVRPPLCHPIAQVVEMIGGERAGLRVGPIGGNAVIELRLRSAVAANQDSCLEGLRVVAGKHQRDLGADAAAERDRAALY